MEEVDGSNPSRSTKPTPEHFKNLDADGVSALLNDPLREVHTVTFAFFVQDEEKSAHI